MWEIFVEIMFEEYSEEYREKYNEMMEDFYEFIIEPHWIHGQFADAPYLTEPGHSATAAPEPPASLSACLF